MKISVELNLSGNKIYLKYRKEAKATKTISNRRRKNIVWFNPPHSENVETNIGHEFLNLITKHFPKHHWLHKICNKNNGKISYSDPSLYRASPIAVSLLRGIFYSAFFTVNPNWLRGFTVV